MSCRRSKINKIREENTSLFYSWALRQRCVFLYIKHADYYIFWGYLCLAVADTTWQRTIWMY